MKNIQINFLQFTGVLLALGIVITGCQKRLDIFPTQTIAAEKALQSESDVLGTLVGCYDGIQSSSLYGGDIMVLNELIGNTTYIRFTGTFQSLSEAYLGQMVADNGFATSTWSAAYNTINRCNNVLSSLDKVTSSDANRGKVEGEALFLRSSMYYELVRLYAKALTDGDPGTNPGVPLILTATTNPLKESDYPSRASVSAVYNQVVNDLVKAESLLPTSNSRYATKWAAAAQLARVYLTLGKYPEARDAANRVLTGSGKVLNPTFANLWFTYINFGGVTPTEYLFYIKVTTQDGVNSLNTYFGRTIGSIPGTAGRSDCKIRDAHRALYEAGDQRNYFQLSGGNYYTRKHLDRFGDVPVIRLAEMYLIRAEGNFRAGTAVGATPLQDVNTIRNRAGLPSLASVTLDNILKERTLELAWEGINLQEAKRLQKPVGFFDWNAPQLILPIPQRETDVNKNLVQNAGY